MLCSRRLSHFEPKVPMKRGAITYQLRYGYEDKVKLQLQLEFFFQY
ncbi:MAG: hypothetical protein ACI9C9_001487 [Marivirga sp.]|jgi:hypothetical protein